jgi:hypothetical protein
VTLSAAEEHHQQMRLVAHLLLVALAVYVVFIQLQNIYFGAFFFGVTPPGWLSWVANLPSWGLDVLATVGVLIVLGLILAARAEHARFHPRRRNRRGGAAASALVVIALLLLLFAILDLGFGLTLQTLIGGLRGFFGG